MKFISVYGIIRKNHKARVISLNSSKNNASLDVWSMDTVHELMNDMVCFEFIRSIMERMENIEAKGYINSYLKLFAPIFIHELVNALDKLGVVPKADQFSPAVQRFISQERQRALKNVITKSPRAESAIKEMGLNFSHEVYDINVVVRNGALMDTNFELYADPLENVDLWNQMFATPRALLSVFAEAFLQHFSFDLREIWHTIDGELARLAQRVDNNLSCTRYSYPSYRLFKTASELTSSDQILILYRFRLVSSARIIPEVIPPLSLAIGGVEAVDTSRFFRKYRALVIEILGQQFKEPHTEFTSKIIEALEQKIDDKSFFRLSRALRNNLHYETTNILTHEETELVDRYQNVYLATIIELFSACLNVDINKECLQVTAYFKACMDRGMSKEEIARHSNLRYLVYTLTGKLLK